MEKKKYPAVNIGSASMLVVFIILCLVTFSVLSVASANRDYTYSKKIADRTTSYYKASGKAETILSQIDRELKSAYEQYGADYLSHISGAFADIEEVENFTLPSLSFSVPINDTQALSVSLVIQVPKNTKDTFYTITSWTEISTEQWDGDTTLNLM